MRFVRPQRVGDDLYAFYNFVINFDIPFYHVRSTFIRLH